MLTNDDKKYLDNLFDKKFEIVDKRFDAVDKRFNLLDEKINLLDKSLGKLAEETVELFNITNKQLEEVNQNLGDKIDAINGVIVNHEYRIEKIENKVFVTTISS